jgi:hypothetical protein
MERVYAEVYPEQANPTGSILLFGAVAKEWHASAKERHVPAEAPPDEHHHTPAYTSKRHFWCKVAEVS